MKPVEPVPGGHRADLAQFDAFALRELLACRFIKSLHMPTALHTWFKSQPRGTMARVAERARVSYPTVLRACKGLPVLECTAERLSRATRGAVRKADILYVRQEEPGSRAA